MKINCPACGANSPSTLKNAKLLACPYCKTTLFLEDDAVKSAGEKSVLTDVPSILSIGKRFEYRRWMFDVYGRIQFDYGSGLWDEWWVVLNSGEGKWISVDEGDIAIQSPVRIHGDVPDYDSLIVGEKVTSSDKLKGMTVTEKNSGVCTGIEGELPEEIQPGEKHDYVHLSGAKGALMTVEYADDEVLMFNGIWVDPFDLKAV